MKRIVNLLVIALIAISSLGVSGCSQQRKLSKRNAEKVEFVSLDKVRGNIKEGLKFTVTAKNNTCHNLRVTEAEAYLLFNGRKIGKIALNNEVRLPRRSTSQVEIPLRATLSSPLATVSAIGNLRNGDFTGFSANVSVTVAAGAVRRTFAKENVTFEELSKLFKLKKK